mmetsp:Transcript_30623/g.59030  ORF Transcript_30623/g.59030 Transcript_30623/m.59030 type:complete len:88 (+) Transcript_30623:2-265(+)
MHCCAKSFSTETRPTDRIFLRGLRFHGFHGVLPEERSLGQKFVVDLTLAVNLQRAGLSDNLEHTVNYAILHECARLSRASRRSCWKR